MYGLRMMAIREIENSVCTGGANCLYAQERVILVFPSCAPTGEINTNITLEWVHKQFITSIHTLFLFLTRQNESTNDDKTMIFIHRLRDSLARFTFYRWRHNRSLMTSQWPDTCDTITRIVISNLLDTVFIHGDIVMADRVRNEPIRTPRDNCFRWSHLNLLMGYPSAAENHSGTLLRGLHGNPLLINYFINID